MNIRRLSFLALALVFSVLASAPSYSQAPVTPGYQIENNASGSTIYSWQATSASTPLPVMNSGASFTNITTNANTVISTKAANFIGLTVNTAGVTSSATVYNNTTCTGAKIGVYSTLAQINIPVGAYAGTGLCVTTAGGTPADITVLWK